MADFYTNQTEENLIYRVIKEGLGFESENDIPKYLILRLALALALRLKTEPLDSNLWAERQLGGSKSKEYHLGQLTGKNKGANEDMDLLYRALLTEKFQPYLKEDLFSDDKAYIALLGKNIQRGLFEIYHSWKNNDCFYQWCKDNLGFSLQTAQGVETRIDSTKSQDSALFEKIEDYYAKHHISLTHLGTFDSYRHRICKVEVKDSSKLQSFETQAKLLDKILGLPSVKITSCKAQGLARTYNIEEEKEEGEWNYPSKAEIENALCALQSKQCNLPIFAGFDIEKKPFYFDLVKAPHLIVAGMTGSGKTIFLQSVITSLLKSKKAEIVVIDPKSGIDYQAFGDKIRLIIETEEACQFLDDLIEEMKERNERMRDSQVSDIESLGLPYRVVFVEELNFIVENNKEIEKKLAKNMFIVRQAGIHLILGMQNPDSKNLSSNLRSSASRIALRVAKAENSRVILGESGAEKLTAKGDMLIKLEGASELKRVFGVKLEM
ncbi:cell division protein FtsK [Helicobacter enhydrae]|uniref:Cell division protein FtsK n=1 Tax=Helicobacter enhydrae TaxID=222136 RepID=A0A1B1U538_9HELI|nr:FtsK/SpoIIIE domain-containing protein [Helicobacter enhydrae]ANV97883.1 cell division protein FtsK [Helicobacter enhydrae]